MEEVIGSILTRAANYFNDSGNSIALPFFIQQPGSCDPDVRSWVQTWVQSHQISRKTVYYDATPD